MTFPKYIDFDSGLNERNSSDSFENKLLMSRRVLRICMSCLCNFGLSGLQCQELKAENAIPKNFTSKLSPCGRNQAGRFEGNSL